VSLIEENNKLKLKLHIVSYFDRVGDPLSLYYSTKKYEEVDGRSLRKKLLDFTNSEKTGYITGINFEETIKEADRVMDYLVPSAPITTPINVLTGLTRLFSGFEKPIVKASKLYGIEYSSLIFELGNRKLVAGQEDLILEVAQKLKENK
jgi:hypothetical protein